MGTSPSTPSHTPETSEQSSLFERIFVCPVCFEKYTGHIMQCKSGHSVCESCYKDLTQCPQCRGIFQGTRNYIMEDFISELDHMQLTPEKAVEAVYKCAKEEQMSRVMNHQTRRRLPMPENDSDEDTDNSVENLILEDLDRRTICMMENCDERPEHAEMEQHLLARHAAKTQRLRAMSNFSKSHFGMRISCLPIRYAFITEFGTFFLIIRTIQTFSNVVISAWIQGACETSEATLFYSWLQFHVKDTRAVYHDYVHGSGTSASDIEGQNQCLVLCAAAQPEDELFVKGYICLNNRSILRARRTTTFTQKCTSSDLHYLRSA